MAAYSSRTDRGTQATVRMRISGHFGSDYLLFVAERAAWLSLSGWASSVGTGRANVVADGPEALVGALEMACLLGPLDALVEAIEVETETDPIAPGFVIIA